jgi:hypothetical protein
MKTLMKNMPDIEGFVVVPPVIAFVDKVFDGYEQERKKKTLKKLTNYPGGSIYRGGKGVDQPVAHSEGEEEIKKKEKDSAMQKVRDTVNGYRRKSIMGGDPCYDTIDEIGSSVYLYSLPVFLVRGLLQGFKTKQALEVFHEHSQTLLSHTGTNYLFLHWPKGVQEDFGDWKLHPFMKGRPDLETTIESLGNWVREKVLLNPSLTCCQPGILANKSVTFLDKTHEQQTRKPKGIGSRKKRQKKEDTKTESESSDSLPTQGEAGFTKYQPPHWDFIGWRKVAAKDMPWILHVPLCKEGMMLHVWPTTRDSATHNNTTDEHLRIGTPEYIHVSFGDALLLRADVAHGGCFGSKGNSRFHMVFRKEKGECHLGTDSLHMLDWSVEESVFQEAKVKLDEIGSPSKFFKKAVKDGKNTVTSYIKRVQATYPCHPNWSKTLFDTVHFDE